MRQKIASITRAARGIGRQIAISMAKAGYDTVVNCRSDREAAKEARRTTKACSRRAEAIYANMGALEDIQWMYEKAFDIFGMVDVVVNNVGVSSEVYFLDATEENFDRMTAVDRKGVYFSSQVAAKRVIEKEMKGVITNISSNQVTRCWPRVTIHAPTKAVVSKFTRNAAMELALKGIRVVDVVPGCTNVGWEPGDIRLEAAKRLSLRRFVTTEEIMQGVLHLASDAADYITGSTLTIDGAAMLPVVAVNDFV